MDKLCGFQLIHFSNSYKLILQQSIQAIDSYPSLGCYIITFMGGHDDQVYIKVDLSHYSFAEL